MDEDYGGTFITIEDEEGNTFELEIVGEMEYDGEDYVAFLPSPESMSEDDPDYGYIILRSATDENGEEVFESIDDEHIENEVYERFMALLFEEEDDGIKQ